MTLHTFREGSARRRLPVLLIHGFPLDHRIARRPPRPVPGTRAVLAVDLPGTPATSRRCPRRRSSRRPSTSRPPSPGGHRARRRRRHVDGRLRRARAPEATPGSSPGWHSSTRSPPRTREARANRLRIADEAETTGSVAPVRPMATRSWGSTRASRPGVSEQIAAWIEDQSPGRRGLVAAGDGGPARPHRRARGFAGPVDGRRRRRGRRHTDRRSRAR